MIIWSLHDSLCGANQAIYTHFPGHCISLQRVWLRQSSVPLRMHKRNSGGHSPWDACAFYSWSFPREAPPAALLDSLHPKKAPLHGTFFCRIRGLSLPAPCPPTGNLHLCRKVRICNVLIFGCNWQRFGGVTCGRCAAARLRLPRTSHKIVHGPMCQKTYHCRN